MKRTLVLITSICFAVSLLTACFLSEFDEIPFLSADDMPVRFNLSASDGSSVEGLSIDDDADGVYDGVDVTKDDEIDLYYIYDDTEHLEGLSVEDDGTVDYPVVYDEETTTMKVYIESGSEIIEVVIVVDGDGNVIGLDTDEDDEADVEFDDGSSNPTNQAPTATAVSITGTLTENEELTGNYTYADADSDAEGISTFKWYRAEDDSGTNETAITGATSVTYTLVAADVSKYIKFEVTPVAAAGESPGTSVASTYSGPIEAYVPPNDPPTATGVGITGDLTRGQTLTGAYTFADADSDPEGTSTFKWYRYDDGSGTNEVEIAGETGTTYLLGENDIGKFIKFEVTPIASAGETDGTPVKSDFSGPVNDWGYGTYTDLPTGDTVITPRTTFGKNCSFEYDGALYTQVFSNMNKGYLMKINLDGTLDTSWEDNGYLLLGGNTIYYWKECGGKVFAYNSNTKKLFKFDLTSFTFSELYDYSSDPTDPVLPGSSFKDIQVIDDKMYLGWGKGGVESWICEFDCSSETATRDTKWASGHPDGSMLMASDGYFWAHTNNDFYQLEYDPDLQKTGTSKINKYYPEGTLFRTTNEILVSAKSGLDGIVYFGSVDDYLTDIDDTALDGPNTLTIPMAASGANMSRIHYIEKNGVGVIAGLRDESGAYEVILSAFDMSTGTLLPDFNSGNNLVIRNSHVDSVWGLSYIATIGTSNNLIQLHYTSDSDEYTIEVIDVN